MKVNHLFINDARRGRWIDASFHRAVIVSYQQLFLGLIAIFLLIAFINVIEAHAQIVQPAEVEEVTNILYGESAGDPEGWAPKLNTYYKAMKPGETMLKAMKRISSAYRTRSKQYTKAKEKDLNAYEKTVYTRLKKLVSSFIPDKSWKYSHHENFEFYRDKQAALQYLRKEWGPKVDFTNYVKIGDEHYFKLLEEV